MTESAPTVKLPTSTTDITGNTPQLLLIVLILGLGWALRTTDLDTRSLWADEGWTMVLSEGPGLDDVAQTLADDQHPPFFFMLFRLWRNVTGDSEFATRYASVLIGMLAVAGMYQLGRTLYSSRAGLFAALVLAIADLHIDLSQEVRHYALLATLIIFSSLFYVRWWRNPTRTNRLGYVLSSILLLYTHYLGGYVLVAQLAHMLLTVRPIRRLANALFLFGSVCAAFLPWFLVFIEQNRVRWDNPLYYQNALPNNVTTYRMIRDALLGQHFVLLGLLAFAGLAYVNYRRNGTSTQAGLHLRPLWPTLFPVIWIVLMIGLTVFINSQREFLTVRNFIVVVPALAVLAGHGLANLPFTTRWFLAVLVLAIGLTTVDARRSYPNWRAVTRNVSTYHLDDEPVLTDVWVGDFPVRYYVRQQMGADTPHISLREWRDAYGVQFLPTLLDYLQQQESLWLVYWGDEPMTEYGDLIARAGFQRTAALSVDHDGTPLYSYRYDRVSGEPVAQFGDMLALHRVHAPVQAGPGTPLRVMLWWTALQPPPLDYSISVFLLDDSGTLVAQHDGPPLDGSSPTSTWEPGVLKFDLHQIAVPHTLPTGTYQLGVRVYWYGDNQRLPVTTPDQSPPRDFFSVQPVQITTTEE